MLFVRFAAELVNDTPFVSEAMPAMQIGHESPRYVMTGTSDSVLLLKRVCVESMWHGEAGRWRERVAVAMRQDLCSTL